MQESDCVELETLLIAQNNVCTSTEESFSTSEAIHTNEEDILDNELCPICLQKLDAAVMTQNCGHIFCCDCICLWVDHVTKKSRKRGLPECPMCKREFRTLYANITSDIHLVKLELDGDLTFKRAVKQYRLSNVTTDSSGLNTRLRRLVYQPGLVPVRINGTQVKEIGLKDLPLPKKQRSQWIDWVARELIACLGYSTDLTVFIALIEWALEKVAKSRVIAAYEELMEQLKPFLQDKAEIFVREMSLFMASPLNLEAYDSAIEYAPS
uniref:RING-type E3 ubiquitin transferase n=1 Tax=Albugo laibachii Nc14 TaxID=890382 RepID=F0WXE0_9STRA|nr:conserved hypothetical protein [Albugo laibachii Nc14]|eukprot:CCA26132.1 conserved hypothetical protein [Albugo laibachii Nc14]